MTIQKTDMVAEPRGFAQCTRWLRRRFGLVNKVVDTTQEERGTQGWTAGGSAENAVIVLSRPMTDDEVSGLDDAPITPFAVDLLVCDGHTQWHLRRMVYPDIQSALAAIALATAEESVVCVRPANDTESRIVTMLTGVVGSSQHEGDCHGLN